MIKNKEQKHTSLYYFSFNIHDDENYCSNNAEDCYANHYFPTVHAYLFPLSQFSLNRVRHLHLPVTIDRVRLAMQLIMALPFKLPF